MTGVLATVENKQVQQKRSIKQTSGVRVLVNVYGAAGAVQTGARAITPSKSERDPATKPAWRRDDIDYDCYLSE